MAVSWVIDVRVNSSLEDVPEGRRFRWVPTDGLREQHIKEGRNMANVEETLVPQVDGLLVQHLLRDHSKGDEVPCLPDVAPLIEGRDIAAADGGGLSVRGEWLMRGEGRECKGGLFEDIECLRSGEVGGECGAKASGRNDVQVGCVLCLGRDIWSGLEVRASDEEA